ncbi:sulfite exporter TauE/SafE family protein [Cupriavidus necator]|uniref:sulfite exporter TauE/SafE family protein n=1 Tax=Cupriavidus necator TaxID=106590 RepID=UPI00148F4DA4|nr:sulfite exporter TauE/SafE family protein [Cupriavidus necator]NOV24254.1 sulfite exporter TauE/SafE family protein [Cupriavidus necator]
MTWSAEVLIAVAGVAIGATSIGGVLVVPVLSGVAGVPLAQAVAASSLAFLPAGLLGWRLSRGHGGATPWALHAAALPGAGCGALLVHVVPAAGAQLWLAGLAAASGLYGLASVATTQGERPLPGTATLAVLGFAVGIGSALSGTGGPVLLLPLLLLLRTATGPALAAALAVQLPVALAATAAHWLSGDLPLALGLRTGALVTGGALLGSFLAPRLPARALRAGASLGLLAVAGWYAIR